IWLRRDGKQISSIDLTGNWLLLAGPNGTVLASAAKELAKARKLSLNALVVGSDVEDPNRKFCDAFGVSDHGASLIRPDGFIAWRSKAGGAAAAPSLVAAFRQILG
ncbi:MAG: monooxygenase, partial [Alphaproteobacteria bacterium]